MPAPLMRTQTLSVVYPLLRTAAAQKQPVAAVYDGRPRLFCPHLLGKNKKVSCERSAIRVEERVEVAYGRGRMVWEAGAVSRWINSRRSSCA